MLSYVVSALSVPLTSGWKLSCFLQVGVRDTGNAGDGFNTAAGVLMEEKGQASLFGAFGNAAVPPNEWDPSVICLDVAFE